MSDPKDHWPDVTVTTSVTKRMTLELNENQVSEIIRAWAKTRGFSHRVEITIECRGDYLERASLEEEIITTN